jgi:predicted AlkP superfamily phosphohydrolase/phosphomutase
MRTNYSRTSVFPQMLRLITDGQPSSPGLLKRLRERIPQRWRHAVKSRLPFAARRRLTSYWRMSDHNWATTRAFALLSDTEGWVRINLKGREALGIVEPGEEYDALCGRIEEGMRSFVDADTGQPAVRDVIRPQTLFKGERVLELPDLVVLWSHTPAASHRALVSPKYGTVAWPTPGRNPEGRSGNHGPQGMLIAGGPGVQRGAIEGGNILDLAPTLLQLLGQPVPQQMEGKPLPLVE